MSTQQYEFKSEVQQLLNLMINSLYSNREIFLRELISNSADALDKLRYQAISDDQLLAQDSELAIRISVNSKAKTISISDNGIGMSEEEVIANLGTIAKSGSAEFLAQLNDSSRNEANIIGQFGVGFYSAFMVADKVEVFSRRADAAAEAGVHWSSIGDGTFTVEPQSKAERGTKVLLHLKKDAREYAEQGDVSSLVNRYSEHLSFPVFLEDANAAKKDKAKDKDKDQTEGEEPEKAVNSATALWVRDKKEIKDEEYRDFYKQISHDFSDPLIWSHNKVEGNLSYTALLYLPERAPFDLWNREAPRGLKLYIKRVFIMDNAEAFLPMYLRFVKGIVDCADLELNVSREILQKEPNIKKLNKFLTKRALELLSKLAKKEEDYAKFWDACGQALKEGVIEDRDNQEKVAGLLRFRSTHDDGKECATSLDAYIERRASEQQEIYYLVAKDLNSALLNPQLEIFRSKGIEVLLLTDRIDEWLAPHLHKYKSSEFKSISEAELDKLNSGGETEHMFFEEHQKHFAPLCRKLQEYYGERVKEVALSKRLTDSPACLVGDPESNNAQLQQFMRMTGQQLPETKPVLELNPTHDLVKQLDKVADAEDKGDFHELADILHFQAQLSLGAIPENSRAMLELINKRLSA